MFAAAAIADYAGVSSRKSFVRRFSAFSSSVSMADSMLVKDSGISTVAASQSNDRRPATKPVCLLHSTSAMRGQERTMAVTAAA